MNSISSYDFFSAKVDGLGGFQGNERGVSCCIMSTQLFEKTQYCKVQAETALLPIFFSIVEDSFSDSQYLFHLAAIGYHIFPLGHKVNRVLCNCGMQFFLLYVYCRESNGMCRADKSIFKDEESFALRLEFFTSYSYKR